MKRFQNFLWVGILCIIGGVILLIAGSGGLENSTFFIFPFFVFSGSDPISIFIILGFMLAIVIFMLRSANQIGGERELLVGGKCNFCSTPLPVGASFCSHCGNATTDNLMENDQGL